MSGHSDPPRSETLPPPTTSSAEGRATSSASKEAPLGPFGILNVKSRVVTLPRRLSLTLYGYSDVAECRAIRDLFGDDFETRAKQIASKHDISVVDASLLAEKYNEFYVSGYLPAILIVVEEWTESSPGLWQDVVEELKKYIDDRVANTPAVRSVDITVEMVAKELIMEKFLDLLDKDEIYPQLVEAWPRIKDRVFEILESFDATAGHMSCIGLFKLGLDE